MKNLIKYISLFIISITMSSATARADYQKGLDAYNAGDDATALEELRPLAEHGDASAQSTLGRIYANGRGVPQDDVEAVKWYRLAAEQGNARAQNSLGLMYDTGRGVPEDDVEAMKWYRLAADWGDVRAQFNLGNMYNKGEGVPQDYVEAYKWWNLAAAQGNAFAKSHKEIVEKKMTRQQIAEGQRLSREWFNEHH